MDIDALTGPDRNGKSLSALEQVLHNIEKIEMFEEADSMIDEGAFKDLF